MLALLGVNHFCNPAPLVLGLASRYGRRRLVRDTGPAPVSREEYHGTSAFKSEADLCLSRLLDADEEGTLGLVFYDERFGYRKK